MSTKKSSLNYKKITFTSLVTLLILALFLLISFYVIYHDDGTDKAFKYGLSPSELNTFIERAKKGDTTAAYVLTVHYGSQRQNINMSLRLEWAWYGLYLADANADLDKLEDLASIIAYPDNPCPSRTKADLDAFFKHWSGKEPSLMFKDSIESFRKKCSLQ